MENEENETVEEDGNDNGQGNQKSGKSRSGTSYPYFGLTKAIEIVEAVRRAGGNEPAANADVMRELNLEKTTDRNWAYGIPAAIQFGLVERVGRGAAGQIKLTDLGIRLALPQDEDEKRAAKITAFKTPELYSKLWERYAGHPVPSRDGLKNLLLRDFEIVESMTSNAADAFLESLRAAELVSGDNVMTSDGAPAKPAEGEKKVDETPPPNPDEQTITVPANYIIYKCKIGKQRVLEIPLPPEFTSVDVKRLYAFLKTQVDDPEELETKPEDD